MTLPVERASSRTPVTWLTIVGAILLPVLLGGVLVASLYNPVERLDSMSAAIVNEDEPVTLDGQTVPLGRQLTAGLVEGSDTVPSNLDWSITNADDAAAGLADGTYSAVVTIPQNFSAAATSTAPGSTPERATIEVATPPDSKVVDDAISAQVTQAAASIMGQSLSEVYLENVFLGFTTLGDQLGTAADGATQLADGARQAADGAAQLPSGASALGTGASQLSAGAGQLATGLDTIAGGLGQSATGAGQLATGLDSAAASVASPELNQGAQATAQYTGQSMTDLTALGATVAQMGAACQSALVPDPTLCPLVAQAAGQLQTLGTSVGTADYIAGQTAAGVGQLTSQTSAGLTEAANQTRTLQSALAQLTAGAGQSATGARDLGSGAAQLSAGAGQLADGSQSLADGVATLATGTSDLASGLHTAVDQVPTYTDAEATSLANVVADPVTAEGVGTNLFGASAIPLLATIALWFGGLGTFVALRAVTARTLASRRPSALLALRGLAPAAIIGAIQGLLVAGVVQLAASYDWADWSLFAAVSIAAGIAFAAVNQALVAVFGGAGRWIAAGVGVLAVATGVVSTVPGVLASLAGLMPTAPVYQGMLAALTAAGGLGASLAGLAIWSILAFLATTLAVTRRRTVAARALLAA